MIKLCFCVHRLPSLTREQFQDYWHSPHAPLLKRHAEVLGIRKYIQVHTRDSELGEALRASRGGPEAYDGVAELWWDSIEQMQEVLGTEQAQAAVAELIEDEHRFADLSRSPIFLAEERQIL